MRSAQYALGRMMAGRRLARRRSSGRSALRRSGERPRGRARRNQLRHARRARSTSPKSTGVLLIPSTAKPDRRSAGRIGDNELRAGDRRSRRDRAAALCDRKRRLHARFRELVRADAHSTAGSSFRRRSPASARLAVRVDQTRTAADLISSFAREVLFSAAASRSSPSSRSWPASAIASASSPPRTPRSASSPCTMN